MATSIPRFLLPRGELFLRFRFVSSSCLPKPGTVPHRDGCRCASSSSAPSKPRVLEKPTRFNPPSHAARLNRTPPRQYPGPPLSAPELEAQKTKRYPHMMPPEGSFMHWFLNNRSIHLWLSMGTLFTLALVTFTTNFHRTSPFAHLLPPGNTFLSHPLDFLSRYIEVFKMHTDHISAETAERRRKKVEDVQKRAAYRKAHGLDKQQGFGGWTAKTDANSSGSTTKIDAAVGQELAPLEGLQDLDGRDIPEREEAYLDWEGKKKPLKKWLGIW